MARRIGARAVAVAPEYGKDVCRPADGAGDEHRSSFGRRRGGVCSGRRTRIVDGHRRCAAASARASAPARCAAARRAPGAGRGAGARGRGSRGGRRFGGSEPRKSVRRAERSRRLSATPSDNRAQRKDPRSHLDAHARPSESTPRAESVARGATEQRSAPRPRAPRFRIAGDPSKASRSSRAGAPRGDFFVQSPNGATAPRLARSVHHANA